MSNQGRINIEVSRSNLRHNFLQVMKLVGEKKMIAIVKSNAYGHDLVQFSKELLHLGVQQLGVYDVDEAKCLILNKIDLPILVLGYSNANHFLEVQNRNIEFSIVCSEQIDVLENLSLKKKINVQLNLETGLNCLGLDSKADILRLTRLHNRNKINLVGAYTHLSCASDTETYQFQIDKFEKFLKLIKDNNIVLKKIHVDNSLSISNQKSLSYCNYFRVGSLLYGYYPKNYALDQMALSPILKLSSKIVRLRYAKKGEYIGYDKSFKTDSEFIIATVPIGFSDGIPRDLSNQGQLLINNKLCNIVGNICMNHLMVDVTNLTNVQIGDIIIYADNSHKNLISFDTHAKCLKTINTSLMSTINSSIQRKYV